MDEADVVLLVVDGAARAHRRGRGRSPGRCAGAASRCSWWSTSSTPRPRPRRGTADFYRLGMADVFPVSAEHGSGWTRSWTRSSRGCPRLRRTSDAEETAGGERRRSASTILGRPNVGKSTLLNALLREERVVANPEPGTTRDPIDTDAEPQGPPLRPHRHRGHPPPQGGGGERGEDHRARRAAEHGAGDVAVLVLDATEPGVDQDARLAGLVAERARALLVVVNKWDLVTKDPRTEKRTREELKWTLKFVAYAPIVFVSALTGSKVDKVLDLAAGLQDSFRMRVPTPALNKLLARLVDAHPAPIVDGRPLRLYYIAQVGTAPPAFAITTNRPEKVPEAYKRYISNQLREAFGLRVPLQLFFREKPGKAKRAARKRPHARR